MDALIEFKQPDVDYRALSDKLMRQWLFDRPYHTKRMYRMVLDRITKFNHRSAMRLDLAAIQAWIMDLQAQGTSAKTISYYQRILKSWFQFIVAQQAAPFNPLNGVRVEKKGPPMDVERALTVEDTRRLMAAAKNPQVRFALELLYQGALRRDELVRLTWGMISFTDDIAVLDVTGKGGRRRKIRLRGALVDFLKANRQQACRRIIPRCGETLRNYMAAAVKAAGLPDNVTPHWLRHSRISHLIMAGMSREDVRDFAGHSSGFTTELYNHALRKPAMPDTLGESDE